MPQAIPYNQALPDILPDLVVPAFEVRMNQAVRLFFQLIGTPFDSAADAKLKASWDALIAATDETKIVFSPLFSGSKIEQSKALETGSDTNATYRGISEYFGEGTAKFMATFRGKDAASMSSLSALTQFSLMNTAGMSSLGVYVCNNDGQFFMNADFTPILVYNFALRTRGTEGLNANDIIGFTFELPPNWDATLIPVIPSFDPRLY